MTAVCCLLLLLAGEPRAAWQSVYEAAGVIAAEANVDRDAMALYGGGAGRTALFDYLLADPLRLPATAREQALALTAAAPRLGDIYGKATWLGGRGVRRGLTEPIPARLRAGLPALRPLEQAIAELRAAGQATLGTPYEDPSVDDLPAELQQELALLLTALGQAAGWRQRAFEDAPAAGIAAHLSDLQRFAVAGEDETAGTESLVHQRRLDRLVAALDYHALNAAATDLALVLDEVRGRLSAMDLTGIESRRWATPLGEVVLAGTGADRHDGPAPLLIVDLGGDDAYQSGAAAAAADRPVAVILDLAGSDRYESEQDVSWGAAVGGIAFLVDQSGDDLYRGRDITQGCGIGGVGVLWDGGGRDEYVGRVHAQGAASFGTGLLVDLAGDDTYRAVQRSQGFGYSLGCGVLVDVIGADRYLADDENLLFPSAQTKEHNSSLSQGFGFGRRADYTDGHGLAGGVGGLFDGGGNDSYTCGVFGQGAAYWYGVGLLGDLGGDDRYHGIWYVQGATAHFAVGVLYDAAGDDDYLAELNMAQGAGHDFSLSFLQDDAGNDHYQAPNLALGAGNANGVGYFWDLAGDDTYEAKDGANLGMARAAAAATALATTPRGRALTAGFFLDGGGSDRYPRAGQGDGRTWVQQQPELAAVGAGADR